MADSVQVIAEVSKVESYTTTGGGVLVKLRIPHDGSEAPAVLLGNVQRIADVSFEFRETHEAIDDETGELFGEE